MKNYNENIDVPVQQTFLLTWNGQSGVNYSGTARQLTASVGSSAVVLGDHVHPNNWSYSVSRVRSYSGLQVVTQSGVRYTNAGVLCALTAYGPPTISPHIYNDLLDRLNEKVRGGIDLSVDAFQAQQTKRMFSASSRVEDYARLARQRGRGVAKLVGSAWLELQYGWRPLLGTIHDAGEKLMNHTVKRLTFKARVKEHLGPASPVTQVFGGPAYPKNVKCYFDGDRIDMMEMAIRLKGSSGVLQSLAGWSSLNPLSIAWELVPYSFVVDWFYDVGGYMRNLETGLLFGSSFDGGYVSTLRVSNMTSKGSWTGSDGYGQGEASGSYRIFNRSALSSYPLPRYPSFRCDLGSGRLLNAAALLTQRLK